MKIFKTIAEIRDFVKAGRQKGFKIAFVPTMGALHEGHISIIHEAKKHGEIVIASIFVNQTQFNDPKDFQNYPKTLQKDLEMLEKSGASAVFVPEASEIFPPNFSFQIIPNSLANCLCGQFRAGHFEGVCLVVAKLFNIIAPDFALFGEKDFQQLAIIRKMVSDLNFPLEIIGCPTIRESLGLAMSSRNQRLSDDGRKKAAMIFKILCEVREFVAAGLDGMSGKDGNNKNYEKNRVFLEGSLGLGKFLQEKKRQLLEAGFTKIDYLEIRDEENLEPVADFDELRNCPKSTPFVFFKGFLPHILVNFGSFLLKFFRNISGISKKFLQKSLKISEKIQKQKDLGQALRDAFGDFSTASKNSTSKPAKKLRIFIAANLEQVRLIDNLEI